GDRRSRRSAGRPRARVRRLTYSGARLVQITRAFAVLDELVSDAVAERLVEAERATSMSTSPATHPGPARKTKASRPAAGRFPLVTGATVPRSRRVRSA